jgi:hypothetical protein
MKELYCYIYLEWFFAFRHEKGESLEWRLWVERILGEHITMTTHIIYTNRVRGKKGILCILKITVTVYAYKLYILYTLWTATS